LRALSYGQRWRTNSDVPPSLSEIKSTARIPLAEVFYPWVRWEGPGSGFESSCEGAGGVWKSGKLENKLNFTAFRSGSKKTGFQTACDITDQKCQGLELKLQAFVLAFRDIDRHLCQKHMRVTGWGI
jgi:hypothetical protein